MHEFYYNESPSPTRRVYKPTFSKASFILKSKRHKSIDIDPHPLSTPNPYSSSHSHLARDPRSRSKQSQTSNVSIAKLPNIGSFQGQILTVDQFNKMVTDEMFLIRNLKRKKGNKSVNQIFQETDPLNQQRAKSNLR